MIASADMCAHRSRIDVTEQPETKRSDRTLAKRKRDDKFTIKVFLSLFDFFCFVYLCFVNLRDGFLFSILVEIYDIFVE